MADTTTTCPFCGESVPLGKRFCGSCGSPLAPRCPSCGAENRLGVRFCEDCGTPLSPAAPPAASQAPQRAAPQLGAPPVPAPPQEERRLVTALFCDLAGFTTLSEQLDPEEVRDIQAKYFSAMAEQIERYGGTVEKYAGDAVLALFGAPLAYEDDPERAVLCALGMQRALQPVADEVRNRYGVEIAIRVGVNTGEVVSGSWTASGQQQAAVTGDAINVAARIQAAAEQGGVLVGAETMRLTRRRIAYGERQELSLKGKAEPVAAYAALGARERVRERWEGGDATPGGAPRGYRTPLVGRGRELGELLTAWGRVQQGEGQLVTLVGEPGVGKSRLVAEALDRMTKGEMVRALRGRCLSYGQRISLWLISDLLRDLFGIREQDAPEAVGTKLTAALTAFLSGPLAESKDEAKDVLGEVLGLLPGESVVARAGAVIRRQALIRSLKLLLRVLAERTPLLLTLEDLHWIDAASAEVLHDVVRDVPGLRLFVLATQRPGWTPPWSEWGWPERLLVRPLPESDAARLAGEVVGGEELSPELKRYLAERAGGNPFFIEELLHTLEETGGIAQRNTVHLVPGVAERLPSTLTEVLLARLDRLDERARRVAQVGSVIGRSFAVRLLMEVTGEREEALEQPLAELAEAEIAFPGRGPDLEYVFKHATMRQVAYQTLISRRRKALHLATAKAIIRLYPVDEYVEMIAYHYSQTEEHAGAAEWLEKAGDRAAAIYASETAIANYQEARKRLESLGGPEQALARLDEKLGAVLHTAGRYEEALPALMRAVEEHRAGSDLEGAGRATALLGRTHRYRGTPEEGLAVVQPMVETLGRSGPSPALAALLVAQTSLFFLTGRYREMLTTAERAAEVAEAVGEERLLGEAEMRRGTALIHLGHLHEALRILVGALRRVEAAGDLGTLWLTLNNLGSLTSRLGEFEQTRQYAERALEVAERIDNPSHISFILGNLGDILTSRGDWDAARDSLARGVEVARAAGPGTRSRVSDVATPLAFLGQLDLRRGDWEEASRLLAEALAAAEESEDRQGREIAQAGLAELDVLAGRAEQAVARLEPLLADDAALGLLLPILAWAYLETGNEESMRRAAELAAEAVSRGREQPGEYLVEPLWMQGMVLVRQGRSKEAQAVLQEGLGLARSLPHPYAEARILYQLGTMPRVWADREAGAGARERLHEALVIFQRLGAKKDIERTEQALAELAAV